MAHISNRRNVVAIAATLALVGSMALAWQRLAPRTVTTTSGKFPEELVYVRSSDDVVNGGAMFRPPKSESRPIAIIWMHGWGVNFYQPTYVMIGRRLAERGFTTIAINTRMHDIGTIEKQPFGKRVRGGGYWGVPSDETKDIASWMDFVEQQGFTKVVLVGHSAGWATVRSYGANVRDSRVVGLVLASGQARAGSSDTDPTVLAQATKLIADGQGEDLVRLPNRSFPSYVSAATYVDIATTSADMLDFFGEHKSNAGVTRVQCPLLAFFGTRESDVGTEADLEVLKASIARQPRRPSSITTTMISGADHMYTGEERQVAQVIARWIDRALTQ
jgi:pimeloyl-ACP methyl ester carboxylesterase